MNATYVCTLLAALSLAAPPKKPPPPSELATFETTDGITITADYYAPSDPSATGKAPVAVMIHMFPDDRASWKSLAPLLQRAGFAVLAYDIRGQNGSRHPTSKHLKERYEDRDPSLFREAWRDTAAAKKWLSRRQECDVSRMALVGASIGCSISFSYAAQDPDVRVIVCLSPGVRYFGLNSIEDIKRCGARPMLLISPDPEYAAIEKLLAATADNARGLKISGADKAHGTLLFHSPRAEQVRAQIVNFLREALPTSPTSQPAD